MLREVDDEGVVEGDCLLVDDLRGYVRVRGVFEDCVASPFHDGIL